MWHIYIVLVKTKSYRIVNLKPFQVYLDLISYIRTYTHISKQLYVHYTSKLYFKTYAE